jgi:hypothetical protein
MHSETDDPNIPSERQSFLKLTRNIATLPLEQSAAALETGAAIATISVRSGSYKNPGFRRAAGVGRAGSPSGDE